jgi:hypothetical protein
MWCVSESDQVKINNLDTYCEWVEEVKTTKRNEMNHYHATNKNCKVESSGPYYISYCIIQSFSFNIFS